MNVRNADKFFTRAANPNGAARVLTTIRDLALSLGLTEGSVCSPEAISEAIQKEAKFWYSYAKETIEFVVCTLGPAALFVITEILSSMIIGSIAAITDTIVNEIIYGAIVGTYMTLVTSALVLIPGASIILQYLLTQRLRDALIRRQTLVGIVNSDLDFISRLLQAYRILFEDFAEYPYIQLEAAYKFIQRAHRLVSIENQRVLNPQQDQLRSIQKTNIEQADKNIDRAINYLTGGGYQITRKPLEEIIKKYQLKTKPPSVFLGADSATKSFDAGNDDTVLWLEYLGELNAEITTTLFTYKAKPGTPEYEVEKRKKEETYFRLITDLNPLIPRTIQLLFLQDIFQKAATRVLELIPVYIAELGSIRGEPEVIRARDNPFGFARSEINKGMLSGANFLLRAMTGRTAIKSQDPSILNTPEYRNKTIRDFSAEIKLTEMSLSAFGEMWSRIAEVGKQYQRYLQTAVDKLSRVKSEIKSSIEEKTSPWLLIAKKAEWVSALLGAKAQFKPFISRYAGITVPGSRIESINTVEVADLLEQADLALSELKDFIEIKNFDTRKAKERPEPITEADKLAQKALKTLLLNNAVIFAPRVAKELEADINNMRNLFRLQRRIDFKELGLAQNVISSIERHPAYPKIKALLDKFLDALGGPDSPVRDLANQLASGDITKIVSVYESYSAAKDIYDMYGECVELEAGNKKEDVQRRPAVADSIMDMDIDAATQRDIQVAINGVEEKGKLVEEIMLKLEKARQDYADLLNKKETSTPELAPSKKADIDNIAYLDLNKLDTLLQSIYNLETYV